MREGKSRSSLPLLVSPSNIVSPARLKLNPCMKFRKKLLSKRIVTVYQRKLNSLQQNIVHIRLNYGYRATYNCSVTLTICTKIDNKILII